MSGNISNNRLGLILYVVDNELRLDFGDSIPDHSTVYSFLRQTPDSSQAFYIDNKSGRERVILLPPSLRCWDYRCAPPGGTRL